ncbi:MAG: 50S ribosomal protein L35 [Ardenticatenaceae bacterium]|nr:50S ribosomal protein L35 [Ardenticatenaceae bacterium]MCB9446085.1 50S ribosomal protein L35 [Ardenticatenaceae bacterium]
MPKNKTKKYKMKTYKAAAKRFRVTGSGKIVRTKGGKSHLRRRKSKRTKALFSKMLVVEAAGDRRRIMRMAPYLKKYKANPPA